MIVFLSLCPLVLAQSYLLKQVIEEGETQTVTVNGWEYEVELVMVSDQARKAIFKVNGESTDAMSEDDTYRFSDGSSILAREILVQEGGDGRDMVQYNLYSGKKSPAPVATVAEEKLETKSDQATVATKEYTAPAPKKEPAVVEGGQEAKVDVTRIVVEKKGWWERFVDWLKKIF